MFSFNSASCLPQFIGIYLGGPAQWEADCQGSQASGWKDDDDDDEALRTKLLYEVVSKDKIAREVLQTYIHTYRETKRQREKEIHNER